MLPLFLWATIILRSFAAEYKGVPLRAEIIPIEPDPVSTGVGRYLFKHSYPIQLYV